MNSNQDETFVQKLTHLNNRREELRHMLSGLPLSIDHLSPERQLEHVLLVRYISDQMSEVKREIVIEIERALFTGELVI